MSKSTIKAIPSGMHDSTNDTLPEDYSDLDILKRKPKDNDSSKKLPADRESGHDILRRSAQDKKGDSDNKIPSGDLSDSDFFIKRKQKKDAESSAKKLPADKENDLTRKISIDGRDSAAKKPDLERKVSEIRRQNSVSGASRRNSVTGTSRRNQPTFDNANGSGTTLDGAVEGKKGMLSELFRRATTKDLANLSGSELPGRINSITRRNSVSSDDEIRKQQPVLTRMNSKLNGLLKTMRWIEDNDGSISRKMVKTMADFGLRYAITKTIGRGTQGKIFMGESKIDQTPVIIKIVEETAIKSFNYVGKLPVSIFLLKILNNPEDDRSNSLFVKYIDHFHVEKTWILVTEHEGDEWMDLLAFLKKRKTPLTEQEIMSIFAGIIQALSDLQTLGFTHNDIKDSNILINSETLKVKLIDIDSCRQISSDPIPGSEFAGTIYYASPEVRTGNFFSPELQEIYSIGVLLLSVIFLSRIPEEIEKHLLGTDKEMLDPHTLPRIFKDKKIDISSSMTKVIQSMLSRKPSKRPEIPDLLGFVHGD